MNSMIKQSTLMRTLCTLVLPLVFMNTSYSASQIVRGDFNGDGLDDLMVGIPSEDVGNIRNAGAVSVFHGTRTGLFDQPVTQIHQDSQRTSTGAAIPGIAEADDRFGSVLTAGDFDNDGYDDAVIGVPNENSNDGAVHIQYGSRNGAFGPRNMLLTLEQLQYFGHRGTRFGAALATGDIDGDGYDDLAVGIPNFDDMNHTNGTKVTDAGAVLVIYGSASGLQAERAGSQMILQSYPFDMVPLFPIASNHFGSALVMDDFNRDGRADLAIGVPDADMKEKDVGVVAVLYGGNFGIIGNKSTRLIDKLPERGDRFGASLMTGDFDGDAYPDLAVGHPFENGGRGEFDSGEVTVFFSGIRGVSTLNPQHLSQRSIDKVENYDNFGHSLVAADFNKDGFIDLAIGAPFETHERRFRRDYFAAGQVTVLFGNAKGLRTGSISIKPGAISNWHQDVAFVAGKRYRHHLFGYALESGDFNNDGFPDLAVSVPGEDVSLDNGSKQKDAGTIHILYGHSGGLSSLSSLGKEVYVEPIRTVGNVAGRAESHDGFGGLPIQPCRHLCSPF